jgi:hypothetical protein
MSPRERASTIEYRRTMSFVVALRNDWACGPALGAARKPVSR